MNLISTRKFVMSGVVVALFLLLGLTWAQQAQPGAQQAKQGAAQPANAQVERGRYIVNDVAMCINCHTPRDASGNIEQSQLLTGASVFLQPAQKMPDWPNRCPRLAGTPPGTDQEMITLLTTGIWKDGARLRQPMPQFRMTKEDAEAVVAYLKSLH